LLRFSIFLSFLFLVENALKLYIIPFMAYNLLYYRCMEKHSFGKAGSDPILFDALKGKV